MESILTFQDFFQKLPKLAPNKNLIALRIKLCEYIRANEKHFFSANPQDLIKIRKLLGWDDDTFQKFIHSSLITNSSPHASLNVFSPNFAHPWLHTAIHQVQQKQGEHSVHMRTMVTHNNLGDLKYKTYGWWHRNIHQKIIKENLFSRNHSMRHKTLLSQAFPKIDISECNTVDKEAITLAATAKNYAYGCIIYRAYMEQAANIFELNAKIEAPLDLLSSFYFQHHDATQWANHFAHALKVNNQQEATCFRTLDENDELTEIAISNLKQKQTILIAHNFVSFALIYTLGSAVITGGKKMYGYLELMNNVIKSIGEQTTHIQQYPLFIGLPTLPTDIIPIAVTEKKLLEEQGIQDCFAIGVNDYEKQIRNRLDSWLTQPIHPYLLIK